MILRKQRRSLLRNKGWARIVYTSQHPKTLLSAQVGLAECRRLGHMECTLTSTVNTSPTTLECPRNWEEPSLQ